ncbi:MAG: GGDEF domain-containing protein [Cognatishimia sp.]|uniref:putative bifunctional diguanylate cyclase/phosphodiesterase n=1 Tax=Cognatishimia sp. TaxID=2211648 RepID=UPI003B8C0535
MSPQKSSDRFLIQTQLKWVKKRPEIVGLAYGLLCMSIYFSGGNPWLMGTALLAPAAALFLLRHLIFQSYNEQPADGLTGLRIPETIFEIGEGWRIETTENQRKFACFSVGLDDFKDFKSRHGDTAAQQVQRMTASRILRGLREDDILTRTEEGEFMFILTPVRHLDLENCIQLASRLKTAIEAAMPLDATTLRMAASIGFCRNDQLEADHFQDIAEAASMAMREATRSGTSAIRSYSDDLKEREKTRSKQHDEATNALQLDQIQAWFQPQISNETGKITGFEALARWKHPERGILSPAEFMEALTKTGQLERLADYMLKRSLEAQSTWEKNGFVIPHVGVNFAGEELRNPMLVEKIHWELDRFNLSPSRISIEVLETVIADAADGAISRNVNGLANLGCFIDLDDFGTGHSSISSIRRFAVSRLKIDRSFVMKVDQDPEQQKLVSAIVTMAERLGMETLAEGVETAGEHAMLAQLGCHHVQGYGIAHPMPFEKTIPWMKEYRATLMGPPQIRAQ